MALWRMITVAASQAALTGATTLLAWSLAGGAAAQAAAFAVALGPLHVSPPPLLAGFAIAQLGHVAGCRACLADS